MWSLDQPAWWGKARDEGIAFQMVLHCCLQVQKMYFFAQVTAAKMLHI